MIVADVKIENGTSIPPAIVALHQNGDSLDADATITSDESNSASKYSTQFSIVFREIGIAFLYFLRNFCKFRQSM